MKPIQFLIIGVMAGLTGCASQSALDSTRSDVDSVKTRLFSVEKSLGGLRSESREGIDAIEKNLKTDLANVRKLSADIQATMDSTKTEMQANERQNRRHGHRHNETDRRPGPLS